MLLSSGIESPRLEERKPAPSRPRVYIYIYTHIYAHPPHVMNIFTLIAGLGDFSFAPVSADPSGEDTLFISTDVSDLSRIRSIYSFRREDEPIEGTRLMISPTETDGRIVYTLRFRTFQT